MCFSAGASFTTAAVLGAAGVAGAVRKPKENEWLYAGIPFFFALMQLIEGAQWLFLRSGQGSQVLGYAFLLFAFFFWPTYIASAVYLMEPSRKRKKILQWFVAAGVVSALVMLPVYLSEVLVVEAASGHIRYAIFIPLFGISSLLYTAIGCGAPLLSSFRWVRVFGAALLISFGVALWFYAQAFASVWCFFTAVLSVLVLVHFYRRK